MKVRISISAVMLLLAGSLLRAQIAGDVIGVHDLGPGSKSPITGLRSGSCTYCHAPHSGIDKGSAPLWNQTLTTQTYTPYTSPTYHETGNPQPSLGSDSNLCLSCHDGTVAPGTTFVGGPTPMNGSMNSTDVFGTNMASSHPFSLVLPINDAPNLVSTLSSGQTADPTGAVKLINGNIECTSCHDPHVQAKDPVAQNFLVKDSSQGAMCMACHDPNRVVQGQVNPLTGWFQSIHATATDTVTNLPYPTLQQNACLSCHSDHNAPGNQGLLRGAGDQVCLNCHSGSSGSSPMLMKANLYTLRNGGPPAVIAQPAKAAMLNVAAEYAKTGHPVATTNTNAVQARAQTKSQAALMVNPNTPSQSGCIDCHDPHAVQSVGTGSSLAPSPGATQRSVMGVSEKDGTTLLHPAQAQYQTCLRCHGPNNTSKKSGVTTNKFGYLPSRLTSVADPMNVIPQFSLTAGSSHPVFHPRSSSLPQPSLLPNMMNLNGTTQGRVMGAQLLCTDCHNSDDNRQFGGTGPSGPHGSKWSHILERRYEFSQAVTPGSSITNLNPNPDLSANGPYALCAKCHNLSSVVQNVSFKQHSSHINAGVSCSVCHSAHGSPVSSANGSGERLVSFDISVVTPSGGAPVNYNRAGNTCTLTCHNVTHGADGSVKQPSAVGPKSR